MKEEEYFDRIIQNEIDQTAPIVYEAAKRASESENGVYRASLLHEEPTHINLGRTQQWIPEIDEDLQFRRPGGGGYILHESGSNGKGTYCFIDARLKNSPKEMIELERSRMAYTTLKALDETYGEVGVLDGDFILDLEDKPVDKDSEAAYYDPRAGDIFLKKGQVPRYDDSQIAGIGLGEILIDDQWVQMGRICMYPDGISDESVNLDRQARENLGMEEKPSLDNRVEPLEEPEKITEILEGKPKRKEAEEFLSMESIRKGRELQQKNGYRQANPCF